MFENFNDGYHANRLHQFVQDFCPSNMTEFPEPWDDASNVIFRRAGYTHIDGGFNATHRVIMPVFPGLTEEQRMYSTFALLPPTLCFGTAPDQCFFFLVRPEVGEHDRRRDRLPVPSDRTRRSAVRTEARALGRGRPGVRATGPGRHRQGAARTAESVCAARAIFVAGGEPRQLQPLARPALSGALAKQCTGRLRSLTSPHRRRRSGSNPSEQIQPVYGLTISPNGDRHTRGDQE